MSDDLETERHTPGPQRRQRGDLTVDDRLENIEQLLDEIRNGMGSGNTKFATHELRIAGLEKIVYGLCAVVGATLAGSVLALVVRSKPDAAPSEPRQVIYMQPPNSTPAPVHP